MRTWPWRCMPPTGRSPPFAGGCPRSDTPRTTLIRRVSMSSTAGEPIGSAPGTAMAGDPEEAIIERAGYKPELRRSLKYFSMFAIAFSIISITTGIFLNYGFGLAYWGPASIWTWPIVGVGNLMIALVVAELGTRIPLAGYAYQWSA